MSDQPRSGMPPLGPPYAPTPGSPPRPTYPPAPPNQWTIPPVMPQPTPATAPPGRGWWSGQRRLFAVVAIATAAVVLLGLVILDQSDDSGLPAVAPSPSPVRPPSSTPPSTTAPTTTTTPEQLNQVIDDIEKFVERERGLTFKQTVPVKLAGENEFAQGILQQ